MSNNTGATSPGAMDEADNDDGDHLELARYIYQLEMRIIPRDSGAPAASEEAIQSLEDVDMTNGGGLQLECAICLDHGEEAAAGWKAMPCGHRFHGGCLEKWLRLHGTCPICRHQMPTAPAPAPPVEEEEAADVGPPESRGILVIALTAWTTTTAINGNSERTEEAAGRREPSDDPNTLFSPRAHLRRRRREDDDEPHRELRRRRTL